MKSSLSFEPRHLLCPVDFSDLSFLALKYAAVGARDYGAELTVLHAQAFELPRYFVRSESSLLVRELSAAKEGARAYLASNLRQGALDEMERAVAIAPNDDRIKDWLDRIQHDRA